MTSPYRRRTRSAPPPPQPGPHTADAWIAYLQRAGSARMTQVEVPDGADDIETRHAWRSAAMRAAEPAYARRTRDNQPA